MNQVTAFATAAGSSVNADAGIITGVSVITVGPALGHGLMIDATTLQQVKSCAEQFTDGLRVKMDHCTGIDAMVGVLRAFRITGDQLRADLHLIKSHADFPKLLEMAQTIPGAFGLSIVFSGTPAEVGQTRFARCLEIYSCDIVDQPAANPSGLFSKKFMPNETAPEPTELASAPMPEAEVIVTVVASSSVETPEQEIAEEEAPVAEPTMQETDLSSLVSDVTALSGKVTSLEVALAAKDSEITSLSQKLADSQAEAAALRAEQAKLSELHAAAKRSLGVMPASVIPEIAPVAAKKSSADYRAEFAAIKDPSARAAFFRDHQEHLFEH